MQENVLLTRQARSSTMKSKPVSLPVHRDCGRAVSAVSRHIPAAAHSGRRKSYAAQNVGYYGY